MRLNKQILREELEICENDTDSCTITRKSNEELPKKVKDERIGQITRLKNNGQDIADFVLGGLSKSPYTFSGVVIANDGETVKVAYEELHGSGIFMIYQLDRYLEIRDRCKCDGDTIVKINNVPGTIKEWIRTANKFELNIQND